MRQKTISKENEKKKRSTLSRLAFANLWMVLIFAAVLGVTLWILGLWPSIFAFIF